MKIENEMINMRFRDHIATVKNYGDDVQVLAWKNPETIEYSITYVFYKNMIFITGDLRDAVVRCTWQPRWNYNWEGIELGYFIEKVTASVDDKYIFSHDEVFKDLKNYFKDYFEYLTEKEYDELFKKVDEMFDYIAEIDDVDIYEIPCTDNIEKEYVYHLCKALSCAYNAETSKDYINNLQQESCLYDYIEDIYDLGVMYHGVFEYYLAGLQMARKQLKAKS